MSLFYVDTSAWLKLVTEETETEAMLDLLTEVQEGGGNFVSSHLLATEMHRAAARLGVTPAGVQDALDELLLLLPREETFRLAGRIPGQHLRSLDALHIAAAIECGSATFVTYDERQAKAANEAGIAVISPK